MEQTADVGGFFTITRFLLERHILKWLQCEEPQEPHPFPFNELQIKFCHKEWVCFFSKKTKL